jgi:hypothetical protein
MEQVRGYSETSWITSDSDIIQDVKGSSLKSHPGKDRAEGVW